MIVPMQSVTVLCLASDRDRALTALRELGVMHLVPVQLAEGRSLDEGRAAMAQARRILEVLPVKPGGAGDAPVAGKARVGERAR